MISWCTMCCVFFADNRVPMVPQALLALLDREALWVSQVREESVGCRDFLDLRCVLLFFLSFPAAKFTSLMALCTDLHEKCHAISFLISIIGPTRKTRSSGTDRRERAARACRSSWC